jgi:hypothetical protein
VDPLEELRLPDLPLKDTKDPGLQELVQADAVLPVKLFAQAVQIACRARKDGPGSGELDHRKTLGKTIY